MLERALTQEEELDAENLCEEILAGWTERIDSFSKANAIDMQTQHMQGLFEDLAYMAATTAIVAT